jgi:uncharacterized protein/trans-aconitate methyltransferase
MHHSQTSIVRIALFCSLMLLAPLLSAEERTARPDINSYFQDPDWQQWVNTFESPGREVFDKRHAIVAASGVKAGMAVADIGAGTGLFTRLFADRVGAAGKVYAVDISQPFVKNILRTSREQGLVNVEGVVNSDKDVSLPADSIDIAFLVDTYHHFEYPVSMLASIRKSLRASGTLIIIDFRRDPHRSSNWVMGHVRTGKDTVIDEVTGAGFQLIDDKPLLHTNYYLEFRKSDSSASQAAQPSFDCSKASGSIEELICQNDEFAALDRKLAKYFKLATESYPAKELKTLKAEQRGWIKGRNDCWKSDDKSECVRSHYQHRITDLQITTGSAVITHSAVFICNPDKHDSITAVIYKETELPAAVLTRLSDEIDEQKLLFLSRSGSGARYLGQNVEFWSNDTQATVSWGVTDSEKLLCHVFVTPASGI